MRLARTSEAPPERLAAFRIALGAFVTAYLVIRVGVFVELGQRAPERFEPVGVFRLVGAPLAGAVNGVVVGVAMALCVAFTIGWRFRLIGPLCAVALLIVATHRSSWGQLLHFENLMVLHVVVVACSPAADAWSVDAVRRGSAAIKRSDGDRYGFPLLVATVVMVVTYLIAGIAKLRYGGVSWIIDDTLRHHIAYSATRLELLGAAPPPFARVAVDLGWVWPPIAAGAVAIELFAPIALFGGRWRTGWVVVAWGMHAGIYATMLVGFPSPLFLVAFAPLFELERAWSWLTGRLSAGRPLVPG